MVCGLLEVFISLLSPRVIRKLFPNLVASVTVILLGVALIGTGMKYWGGGVVCAEMIWKEHAQVVDSVGFPPDFPVFPFSSATCSNGDVALVAGSPEYIGLGFSVFAMLVLIELFGSVFMKNCNVILALLFGYLIAALSSHEGNDYVLGDKIRDAEPITFLWVETFPLGKLSNHDNFQTHSLLTCNMHNVLFHFRFLCSSFPTHVDWVPGNYYRDCW